MSPIARLTSDSKSGKHRKSNYKGFILHRNGKLSVNNTFISLPNYVNAQRCISPVHALQQRQPRCERLFDKVLTPSDVGSLNHLVIPKEAAEKYFPPMPAGQNMMEFTFRDVSKRVWKFHYCRWESSHSYVFTRGWNAFVNVNNLRSQDLLTFWRFIQPDNMNNQDSVIYVIEVTRNNQPENGNFIASATTSAAANERLNNPVESIGLPGAGGSNENSRNEDEGGSGVKKKGFRLFGVQIV